MLQQFAEACGKLATCGRHQHGHRCYIYWLPPGEDPILMEEILDIWQDAHSIEVRLLSGTRPAVLRLHLRLDEPWQQHMNRLLWYVTLAGQCASRASAELLLCGWFMQCHN